MTFINLIKKILTHSFIFITFMSLAIHVNEIKSVNVTFLFLIIYSLFNIFLKVEVINYSISVLGIRVVRRF